MSKKEIEKYSANSQSDFDSVSSIYPRSSIKSTSISAAQLMVSVNDDLEGLLGHATTR